MSKFIEILSYVLSIGSLFAFVYFYLNGQPWEFWAVFSFWNLLSLMILKLDKIGNKIN